MTDAAARVEFMVYGPYEVPLHGREVGRREARGAFWDEAETQQLATNAVAMCLRCGHRAAAFGLSTLERLPQPQGFAESASTMEISSGFMTG